MPLRCPACGMGDAYFTFEHGIGIGEDLKNGGTAHLDLTPDVELQPYGTVCRHCFKDVLPRVEGITISYTRDL